MRPIVYCKWLRSFVVCVLWAVCIDSVIATTQANYNLNIENKNKIERRSRGRVCVSGILRTSHVLRCAVQCTVYNVHALEKYTLKSPLLFAHRNEDDDDDDVVEVIVDVIVLYRHHV